MKTCVIALTNQGRKLAKTIALSLDDCDHLVPGGKVAEQLKECWNRFDAIICIMASGIVVRSIAPLVANKGSDPCIVVLDQHGKYCISLLSGHLGGGNNLAARVAAITGGQAVITTASDNLGKTALDLWAERNKLVVFDKKRLTTITADFLNGKPLAVYREGGLAGLPPDIEEAVTAEHADIVITFNKNMTFDALCCISKTLYIGVGCNRGTSVADITAAFDELCREFSFCREAIAGIGTIDVKNDEEGILEFADSFGISPSFFTRDELNNVPDVAFSAAAMKAVGAKGVAEPAAMLTASAGRSQSALKVRKHKWKDVTMAVAERIVTKWE